MDNNQKDDIKMVNSNHINEVGGMEDDNNRAKFPDAQNHKLTGTAPGGGEFGGHDAIQNDVVRYIDFINGKGDYGTAGRDHFFAVSSLAIVNPVAAGAILGAVGLTAAIHGIATSTFVRTLQAKRRLNHIYKEAIGPNGYNPSGYYVALFGTSIFKSKDKDGSSSYGPKAFRKYYDRMIQKFNSDVKSAGILDANGNYTRTKRDKNQEENYATAGSFVATSIQQFYIPDSVVSQQQSVYKGLQSNVSPNARYALTKEYGNLLKIINDAAARTNTTPLYAYVTDQIKGLKEIGDGICEGFDRKMGHALKNGKYRASQSSQGLKKLWEKYMKDVTTKYNEEIADLVKSQDYIKLRKQVEALSKVCKESEIVKELSDALNVGGVFVRKNSNGKGLQMWKVAENNVSHDRKAVIYPVNVRVLAGNAWDRKLLKSDLFDRNKFGHYVEVPFSGDVKVGGIYKISFEGLFSNGANIPHEYSESAYIVVQQIINNISGTSNRTQVANARAIVYYLVNFTGTNQVPQWAYVGGNLSEEDFLSAVQAELEEDTVEMQNAEGHQMLQPGKTNDSVNEPFDSNSSLNEDDNDNQEGTGSDDQNNTEPQDDNDGVTPYNDIDSKEFSDYVYVLPGIYSMKDKDGADVVISVKKIVGGKVEYNEGDKDVESMSFSEWNKKAPRQLPSTPQNSELTTLPGPPRNIPDNKAGDHKYKEPKYPLTYTDFYKSFLHTIFAYKPVLELHKDKLSEYGLYVKNGEIGGIYSRDKGGADQDFSMHIPYNFTPYIRSLGDAVLFESEEDFKKYITTDNTHTHESIVESFNRLMMLNESVVNEASYDEKSVKTVKKNILDALQRKWVSIFNKKYDIDKQKEIVSDSSSKRDDILKKIDREALDKIVEEYKVHVLTKTLKDMLGEKQYNELVKRIDYIAKEGPDYINVDRKANVNYDTIDKDRFLGSTYGRIQKNVETIPDFDTLAQKLAEFNKEINDKCSKLSKEDREKVKTASKETVNDNTSSNTTTNVSATTNGDGNNTNVNNGDGNVTNNNSGNITIVNNLNGVDLSSLIPMLYGTENLEDLYGDIDLEHIDDNTDETDTPVVKPEIVKGDDSDLRNILLVTCADIIDKLVNASKEIEKVEDDIIVEAIKNKKPEYYTFGSKEKDELLRNGDDSKLSLNSDESKKLAKDVKEKFIVKEGRILAKIVNYDKNEDSYTFATEDGEYTIKGSDTIKELDFEYAQQNTDDVVNEMLQEADLPTIGTVLEIQEDVLRELVAEDTEEKVNDSAEAVYRSLMKLYEDGDEDNAKYVRVIVSDVKLDKGLYLKDAEDKEYILSIDKLKEYGAEKFNKACRSVNYLRSDAIKNGTKYEVDKDYFNNVIVAHASDFMDTDRTIEKTEDERIIKVIFLSDDSSYVCFRIVSTDEKVSVTSWAMSYLYLDPSKLTQTDKDPNADENIEYNKDEMYIITNYDEVKDLIIEHANESSQEYAYYKLYGMHLNEDDSNKDIIMKIVNVEGDKITFSLNNDKFTKTYTLTKEDLSKFKLEKYEEKEEDSFDTKDYEEWDSQVPYPIEDITNLVKTLEAYKQDAEKKKLLLQFIEKNRQLINNSGVTGANDDEIIDELIATAHKFSDEHEVAEGGDYNMLYVTPSASMTNNPVNSVVVHCDKKTDSAYYFSLKDAKNKFYVPEDKMKSVYFYPLEKKNESALVQESVGVTIKRHQYALYKLYGGSLLEAVNINPSSPQMMSALVNMLVSANKALSAQPQTQPQDTEQPQTQQQDGQNQQPQGQNQQPQGQTPTPDASNPTQQGTQTEVSGDAANNQKPNRRF